MTELLAPPITADFGLATELTRIVDAAADLPPAAGPGGWPNEIEAALIDSVLTIRSRYGRPGTGVRRSIGIYRGFRRGRPLDDLGQLAALSADQLARVLQNETKADAIVAAAWNLTQIGVHSSKQLDALSEEHRRAYICVAGLSPVTWEYFCLNLGKPGVLADTWLCRWMEGVLGRAAGPIETRALMVSAAKVLRVSPVQLDHSIWTYMSTRDGAVA